MAYKFYVSGENILIPLKIFNNSKATVMEIFYNEQEFVNDYVYKKNGYVIYCSILVPEIFLIKETEINEEIKRVVIDFIFNGLEKQIQLGNAEL